jgi:hypothetical protein
MRRFMKDHLHKTHFAFDLERAVAYPGACFQTGLFRSSLLLKAPSSGIFRWKVI